MRCYQLGLICLMVLGAQGYADEFAFDTLGAPKCEEGQLNCKRVSERRKKKLQQKEQPFLVLPKDDPEQVKIDNMMRWLKSGSVELPKMDIVFFFKNFRGAVATRKIFTGDTILFVPKSHLMTYESSVEQSPLARRLLAMRVQLYNARHTVVAMHILEEKEKPDSFWKPYLDMFPDNYHEFPLQFGAREFAILQNSSFIEDVEFQQKEFKQDYQRIIELVPEFNFFSYEEFAWARLAVQSRIFGIGVDGEQTQAMVPFADMLNHARVHPTEWSYNQQRQGFVITAKSDIDKGTEIYDTYGRKLNRVFYSNYGFLEDGNDLNVADIHTCLSARDSLYHFKLRLINQKACLHFRIQNSTSDQQFFAAIGICRTLAAESLGEVLALEKAPGKFTKAPALSVAHEVRALKLLQRLCEQQLLEYPTTIEEDIEIISQEKDWATRNIYNLRKLEKSLIRETGIKVQYIIDLYEEEPDSQIFSLKAKIEKKDLSIYEYTQYIKTVYLPLVDDTLDP